MINASHQWTTRVTAQRFGTAVKFLPKKRKGTGAELRDNPSISSMRLLDNCSWWGEYDGSLSNNKR
jgi:hypothetical protein